MRVAPPIPKWPFFLGDIVLSGLGGFVYLSARTAGPWPLLAMVACFALGAGLGVLPFVLEYRALIAIAGVQGLSSVVSQIKHVEQLAAQIGYATNQWQLVRESSDRTAAMAKEIARGMASEVKAFTEFLQRSNEGEKATLRLEAEKLRRAESEWLQVVVRMLDHVYALHQAALRSHQPGVAEQLGKFQSACHEAARRVGLSPFVAIHAEPFDAQRHQVVEGEARPPDNAAVDETLASGYTFQGRLLRPAVVRLRNGNGSREPGPHEAPH